MKEILHPDFTLGKEPTIGSCLKKNEDGICAYHNCQNLLSDPPYHGWCQFKICNVCKEKEEIVLAKEDKEMWEEFIGKMSEIIGEINEKAK